MKTTELLDLYFDRNADARSLNTERLYRTVIGHWARWLGKDAVAADFTSQAIVAYLRHRRAEGRAEATVENEGVKLVALAKFAAGRGLCPTLDLVIRRKKPDAPQALLRHQIRALFKTAAKSQRTIAGHRCQLYFPALLGIIWHTGERISAVVALSRTDIDLVAGTVTFRHRKGRGATMVKSLPWTTRWVIRKWLNETDRDNPFAIVGLSTIYYHLEQVLIEAGIPAGRRNKFHALRRSHASYLKVAGGDATESLGHDSEKTTRTHYYDPRITNRRSSASYLFNPFSWWHQLRAIVGR